MQRKEHADISAEALVAFLGGLAAGAAAGLLLAPGSGRDARAKLGEWAERAGDTSHEAFERTRELMQERTSLFSDALQAGREAIRRERERLMSGLPIEPEA